MKRLITVIIAVFICMPMTGCEFINTNIENLAAPPKMTKQQIEIYSAMKAVNLDKSSITLKYPQNGDYRSAIIIRNIDEEPDEEALVFYEQTAETETNLFMSVLDQAGGEWMVKWDTTLIGTDIDKVNFFTDNNSGRIFIIVGTSNENDTTATGNNFQIFSYYLEQDDEQIRKMESVYTGNYRMLEVYDIDDDGENEIITITQTEKVSESSEIEEPSIITEAVLIQYQYGSFWANESQSVPVNSSVLEYVKITKNATTFGKPALFLDELVSESTYGTEILVFEQNRLKNLTYSPESSKLYNQTLRAQVPYSYDILSDGKLEIPQTQYMNGYDEYSDLPMYITTWHRLNSGEMEQVRTTYINYAQGYGIRLPENWAEKISAKTIVESEEVDFFIYKGSVDDESEKIFTLKVDTSNNIQNNGIPDGYFKIKSTRQLVFLAKIHMDEYEGYQVTKQNLTESFIDLYAMGD